MIDFLKAIKHAAIDQWDDRTSLALARVLNKAFRNIPDEGIDVSNVRQNGKRVLKIRLGNLANGKWRMYYGDQEFLYNRIYNKHYIPNLDLSENDYDSMLVTSEYNGNITEKHFLFLARSNNNLFFRDLTGSDSGYVSFIHEHLMGSQLVPSALEIKGATEVLSVSMANLDEVSRGNQSSSSSI